VPIEQKFFRDKRASAQTALARLQLAAHLSQLPARLLLTVKPLRLIPFHPFYVLRFQGEVDET
jgi:hypothetical protein